ncbi:hypothetical protein OJAV_G00039280 [Oryzias javanicus]|uniref:Uncharacterized protein n=1 Tax=Oryzias javanicus TaxID=123683 RepID=A0A437DCG5_ORYJA|nr:hypothetical protein OJAV_G00039280 [Oryzias javanicus]
MVLTPPRLTFCPHSRGLYRPNPRRADVTPALWRNNSRKRKGECSVATPPRGRSLCVWRLAASVSRSPEETPAASAAAPGPDQRQLGGFMEVKLMDDNKTFR